jgi:hypothetical protein
MSDDGSESHRTDSGARGAAICEQSDATYNAKFRGSCGREEFGGAHSAAAERGSTERDNDCDPKREEEGQSGQKGCQGGHGER